MEVVNFDKRSYDMIMDRFNSFATRVEQICSSRREFSSNEWLDNQDVCSTLSISKRTLQSLRDNGSLPFTKINHKVYYRCGDIEKFLKKHKSK